jgi:hypothetical protein
VLSFPYFYLSKSLTLKEHRQDSYLIHGVILTYVVFEIQHFSAIPRTDCHLSRSITSFLQRCHLRNIVFPQEDHPLNCPFYQKSSISSIMPLLHWWTTHVKMFFRLIKEVKGHYECFSDVYTKFYCCSLLRPFLKKTSFFELWRFGHDTFKPW